MFYTIYKITNQINGKFYIGSHKTKNLNDGYMGSGKYLIYAQEKHGIENFTKEILFVFDNPKDMYAKEAEIVNKDFLVAENTYNLKIGGFGGWDYINENHLGGFSNIEVAQKGRMATNAKLEKKYGPDWRKTISSLGHKKLKSILEDDPDFLKKKSTRPFLGKFHTDETKKKIGNRNSINQAGCNNSQYGTMWINNGSSNKKIKKDDPLPEEWVKGRV